MALSSYTVARGDTLWKIASGGCGKDVAASISGSSTNAKINTLVSLNNIKNRNLIYVGQKLKLSGSSSSSSSKTTTKVDAPVIDAFGLQSEDTTGRAMYVTWDCSVKNTKSYKIRWTYFIEGVWVAESDHTTTSYEDIYCYDTFSAPATSTKVKVKIMAVPDTYEKKEGNQTVETPYWTKEKWSSEKLYEFKNNPPYPPSIPSVEIEDLKLTASIDNIDATELNAEYVEFQIIKDNASSIASYPAKINTTSMYVAYTHDVAAGSEYKVRARCKKGSRVSGWTDFSSSVGTKPSAPKSITTCKAKSYEGDKVSAYLEWTAVSNADTYEIEYTTNQNYFDGSDGTSTATGIEFNHYELTNLDLGDEYFFRVRAVNSNGDSDWSEIKSLVVGTTPIAPTTWSSVTNAIIEEPVNLYWVHNAKDNSTQTYAEIRLFVNDVQQVPDITVRNDRPESEKDKTSVYALDTTDYPEGAKIKWQVRTAGITNVYGEWSIPRVIDIYARPTLDMAITTLPDGSGDIIDVLTSFPFYIHALPGPATQAPIGYQLKVTANEYYETIDDTGKIKMVNKGEDIYSKYFDINNTLIVEMSANNIDIQANIEYTITCTVTMNSGLSTSVTHDFTAEWDDVEYDINAEVTIDHETLTALISPYCEDAEGNLIEDITLSVYRREYDGTFKEISTNIPNTNSVTISDPHPALDYARYRIVGKTTSTGAISYHDLPGVEVGGKDVIIQWNEDWSVFDSQDEFTPEKPAWSGSILKLPYNIDVSDNYKVSTELIQYAGREYPVSYYGTQIEESSTWTVTIPAEDTDTLYVLRRLAKWKGDVYVREPSGSGYWANLTLSFSQAHKEVTIPVTLTLTRVEGGI